MTEPLVRGQKRRTPEDAAIALGLIEIGLGSVLHAFYVPLRGHLLSLNQSFFLTRMVSGLPLKKVAAQNVQKTSLYVALIKALAPAGARLTPMLAITAQGFLFSLAVGLLGTRWVGLCFGATLLAFWAVIQPIALGLIVFGASAVRAAEWLRQMVSSDLAIWGWWVFGGLIGLKVLLANLLVVVAVKASSSSWGRFEEKLTSVQLERRSRNNVWPAIWWLVSGALLVTFSIVVEARAVATVWLLLRIGAGVLFVFWLRALLKEARVQRWILNRYPDLAHVLREVTGISRPN